MGETKPTMDETEQNEGWGNQMMGKGQRETEMLEDGQRDIKIVVGENVKRYREEAGLKRTKFARMMGYKSSNLERLEEGGLNIGIEKLQEIANVLHVNVISLIEDWEGVD